MNAKKKLTIPAPIPKVGIPITKLMIKSIPNHFQSPLNKGGNRPKKNTVQEKPTLTWLNKLSFIF